MNERTRPTTSVRDLAAGNKPANPVASFSRFLDTYKPQIALVLPKHLNADRMARLALSLFSSNEKLRECSPQSIVSSVMQASALGLEVGVMGHAYLIPYKTRDGMIATFVPGWKGLVDLVNRSGTATVWTGAVFEGDEFDYALGSDPFVKHKPAGETDPAKLTHVYSVGRINGAAVPVLDVWSMPKVWRHRDEVVAKLPQFMREKHYSLSHPEMYARKVVLLQVIKYMPTSVEVRNALAANEAAELGQPLVIDGEFLEVGETAPARPSVDAATGEVLTNEPAKVDEKRLTYAELVDLVNNAPDAAAAGVFVDRGALDLPSDQSIELEQVWKRKWTVAS